MKYLRKTSAGQLFVTAGWIHGKTESTDLR